MNVASAQRPKAKPAPRAHGRERPTLRILGTEITLLEELRLRAEDELGIRLEFEVLDFLSAQRKAATEPHTYDIYDQCFHNLDIVWFWRAIQPIDLARIVLWDEVTDLTKTGRITANARIGYGDAPVSKLFVQPSQALGAAPSRWISMLPTVHNLDAFAFRIDKVNGESAEMSSWAALLDPKWSGSVALVDEPAIGIFDAAMAAQASGLASFTDIGNMSTDEIDHLLDVLMERKRAGHFHGFWKTAAEAAEFMAGGDVIVESMWSPGVSALRRRGVAVQEAVPQEGYRAWHGGLCLSRRLEGATLDTAYEYLNWWLSGFPGAVVARQGYYMSVPNRVKAHLTPAEWAYWYEGKPAETDLAGPDGNRTVAKGSVRSGGSYWQRASTIAVWNTTMDEHNYLVRRWAHLVSA